MVDISSLSGHLKYWANKLAKKEIVLVLLIFILAIAIRGHLMKYELFFEFDTYYHARLTGYILQNGYVPDIDPLGYYFGISVPFYISFSH